ncbi:MAG: hypothetical protein KBT27_00285 [Prevotellaceae bacterium]|nr:hypothetical protein [Candidatus Faecinaster equi]
MLFGAINERCNGTAKRCLAFHRWKGVTMTGQTFTYAPFGTKGTKGKVGSATSVVSFNVTAEHEYLMFLQQEDVPGEI